MSLLLLLMLFFFVNYPLLASSAQSCIHFQDAAVTLSELLLVFFIIRHSRSSTTDGMMMNLYKSEWYWIELAGAIKSSGGRRSKQGSEFRRQEIIRWRVTCNFGQRQWGGRMGCIRLNSTKANIGLSYINLFQTILPGGRKKRTEILKDSHNRITTYVISFLDDIINNWLSILVPTDLWRGCPVTRRDIPVSLLLGRSRWTMSGFVFD